MRKKQVGVIAIKSFALLVVLGTAYQAMAQDAERPYPEDAATFAVFNGRECGNRAGAKRRSGGHFKGCVCFGADAQRLGNSGQRYERFCVHGGAVMDGQH